MNKHLHLRVLFVLYGVFACGLLPMTSAYAISLTEEWYLMRGKSNMNIGNFRAAIEAYEKAYDINPKNNQTSRSLGLAFAKEGLFEKSRELLEIYIVEVPGDAEVLYQLGEMCSWKATLAKQSKCAKYFQRGLASEYHLDMHRKYAQLLSQNKSTHHEAITEYQKILANNESVDPKQRAADKAQLLELLASDPRFRSQAIDQYRKYIRLNPADNNVKLRYARLISQEPDFAGEAADIIGGISKTRNFPFELELERAHILVNIPERFSEACTVYESLMKRKKDPKLEEEFADLLARLPRTRIAARAHYAEILKSDLANRRVRLKYGKILLADSSGAKTAIEQYNYVLGMGTDAHAAEAHHGAALAYSANGDSDLALFHAREARRLGDHSRDLDPIEQTPEDPHGDNAGIKLGLVHQAADENSGFDYRSIGWCGRFEIEPKIALEPEFGMEKIYSEQESASGSYVKAGVDWAATKQVKTSLGGALHSIGPGYRHDELFAGISATLERNQFHLILSRKFRTDSFAAYVGENFTKKAIGAARNQELEMGIDRADQNYVLSGRIEVGQVVSGESDTNAFSAAKSYAEYDFQRNSKGLRLGAAYRIDYSRYAEDFSGFSDRGDFQPKPGAYFSPQFFISQGTLGVLELIPRDSVRFKTAFGPNWQVSRSFSQSERTTLGIEGFSDFKWSTKPDAMEVSCHFDYFKLPDIDLRLTAQLIALWRI